MEGVPSLVVKKMGSISSSLSLFLRRARCSGSILIAARVLGQVKSRSFVFWVSEKFRSGGLEIKNYYSTSELGSRLQMIGKDSSVS